MCEAQGLKVSEVLRGLCPIHTPEASIKGDNDEGRAPYE